MADATVSTVPRGWNYAAHIPWQVPGSLDDLHGSLDGVVRVPPRIDTGTNPVYDLSNPQRRYWFYVRVVRDGTTDEQEEWLDKDTLIRAWPDLVLPEECRVAWESRFPELRYARLGASAGNYAGN